MEHHTHISRSFHPHRCSRSEQRYSSWWSRASDPSVRTSQRVHVPVERGIVLLEAIVAVGVLVTMVGAILGLTIRSLSATRSSTDRLVATYLAQDAGEWLVARQQHNESAGGTTAWDDGISTACVPPPGVACGIDTIAQAAVENTDVTLCSSIEACKLYRTAANAYTHVATGNTLTPYTRTISSVKRDIDGTAGIDEIEYTITVSWKNGPRTESLPLIITLYDQ